MDRQTDATDRKLWQFVRATALEARKKTLAGKNKVYENCPKAGATGPRAADETGRPSLPSVTAGSILARSMARNLYFTS
jgi:hypothetical protein